MINPRGILSLEDIKLLEANDIKVPYKKLTDEELDNLNIKIAINLAQDDSERRNDLLSDNVNVDDTKHKCKGFDDTDIEKQWDEMYKRGKALRAKYPDMKMPDFLISDSEDK